MEDALQSLTWAIQRAPRFAAAYVARGAVYLAQGEPRLALADADAALEVNPAIASAYVLRGEALRLQGYERRALKAFDQALLLDPSLRQETFRARWLAARAGGDADRMMTLSREYGLAYPSDPLRTYYRSWGLIESGRPRVVINALVESIEAAPDAPAVLWFTLGEAYAAEHAWENAIACFEASRVLVQAGDMTLLLHSERPLAELAGALGRAYLGAGQCADAETMLEYAIGVGGSSSAYGPLLESARICQTPTPTITPYPTTTPSIW